MIIIYTNRDLLFVLVGKTDMNGYCIIQFNSPAFSLVIELIKESFQLLLLAGSS